MTVSAMTREDARAKLIRLARKWRNDPLAFARNAFAWGKGALTGMEGPDEWQTALLSSIRDQLADGKNLDKVVLNAVAAGHGVGKSGCVAWLILWAISTVADTRGVVTANTAIQLSTKTWAELAKWYHLCIFRPWFELSATAIVSRQPGHDRTWRIDAIPWSDNNPEAFAGLHNQGKRILVIFDEASAISDKIWEVTEGAMTDKQTQIVWLAFGNPTRNVGRFYDCFNRLRHRWVTAHVDARTAAMSNKDQIKVWQEDYGEESDFFKVRVRGVFPSGSDMQFIPRDIVDKAIAAQLPHVPYTRMVAIMGVDVARFGADSSVICVRFGMDARSMGKREYRELDGWRLGAKVAEWYNELKDMGVSRIIINIDSGGIGASPVDWLQQNGYPVNAINFGSKAADQIRYGNLRAEMWGRMREWLKAGGCIADDDDLATDLTSIEYDYNVRNQLMLEQKSDMKARGLASPDNGDALALTFAVKVNEYIDDLPTAHSSYRRQHQVRDPYRA
ncbi:MAG: terminase [Duodenibacillus sp.]|nr:terminase [Duodenibacillus sp.]